MWNSIYDYLVQLFAGLKWSAFLAQNNNNLAMATKMRNVFRNDIYPLSGMITLIVTVIIVLIYYFVVNRRGGAGYAFKTRYWMFTLLGNSIGISLIMFYVSVSMTKSYTFLHPLKYSLALCFSNLIYTALLFFIISVIVKRFSVANTTPF